MKPNPNSKLGRSTPQFLLTKTAPIIVLRQGAGSYVNGYWQNGTQETLNREANVQPMKGWELQSLPESDRSKESIKVYGVDDLRTVEEVGATKADIVVWQGKKFQVMRVMKYEMGILDHTKAICYRLPETPQNQASYTPPPTPPVVPLP